MVYFNLPIANQLRLVMQKLLYSSRLAVCCLSLATASAAIADSKDSVFLLNSQESLLHISATESRQVDQDLLTANLRIEAQDKSNQVVQNKINSAMTQALAIAKSSSTVRAITRGYRVHEYNKNHHQKDKSPDMVWKGQQSLLLKSKDTDALLALVGKIQAQGFVMSGLNYSLSPEVAAQIQDEMLEAALKKLSQRAQRAALSLGKTSAELKEINTQDQHRPRQSQHNRAFATQAMSADTHMTTPVATPGETTLSLQVHAKALLK